MTVKLPKQLQNKGKLVFKQYKQFKNDKKYIKKSLYPKRIHILNKRNEKIIIFNSICGSGKTRASLEYAKYSKYPTIFFSNSHSLSFENIKTAFDKFKNPFSDTLLSKNFKLNKDMKKWIKDNLKLNRKPDFLCKQCEMNKYMKKSIQKGYLPRNYCKDRCKFNSNCLYFKLKSRILKVYPNLSNRIIFLVKSYFNTNIIKGILKQHAKKDVKINIVIDENIIQMLFETIDFEENRYDIRNYIKYINKVVKGNQELETIWKEIKEFFNVVLNNKKTMKDNGKTLKRTKEYKKQSIKDIITTLLQHRTELIDWNESIKDIIVHDDSLKSNCYNNYFYRLQKILDDLDTYNWKKDSNVIDKRIEVDEYMKFNYLLKKIDGFMDIINNKYVNKVIINSTDLDKELFKDLTGYTDPIYELNDDNLHSRIECRRYTSGTYNKPILYDQIKHKFRKGYTELLKITKQIIRRHKNNKIIVIAYKVIINKIKKDLEKFIYQNRIDVKTAYWFNTHGTNQYKDRNIMIQFGNCGISQNIIDLFVRNLNITEEQVRKLYETQEQFQTAERMRSIWKDNPPILYQLCKNKNPNYKYEKTFNKIHEVRYKNFLEELKKYPKSTFKECLKLFNKNRGSTNKDISIQYLRQIINEMVDLGILKKEKKSSGRGRPSYIFSVL
ncbi:MAG: hypothetical protein ACOCUI_02650 [bacterium]